MINLGFFVKHQGIGDGVKLGRSFKIILKILFVMLLFLYINYSDVSYQTAKFDASLTLIMSVWLLYKSRKGLPITLPAFFIFYCIYSIVIGEYLVGGNLGIPVYEVKTVEIYGLTIRVLLLFTTILALFYKGKKIDLNEFKLVPKDNVLIFYSVVLGLFYTLIFGINRGEMTSYSVSITPLYEYSTLLFLFAFYYSGKSKIRKVILIALLVGFILQDFYFGGRITSLQLIFLSLLTLFLQKLSFKSIVLYGSIGIVVNGFIGAYRTTYSLGSTSFFDTVVNLKNNLFVFDTPVYAYYASATHVAASGLASLSIKLESFLGFIGAVLFGVDSEIGNLTRFISANYFNNIGGGVVPTHFFFWLGWAGVILIGCILVYLLNRAGSIQNDFQKLSAIIILSTTPRWFLYNPLNLFRPLVFLTVLFLVFFFVHKVLLGISSKKKPANL